MAGVAPAVLLSALLALLMAAGTDGPPDAGETERLVFGFDVPAAGEEWEVVTDAVMGGVSNAGLELADAGTLVFSGQVSLDNYGGFASVRSRPRALSLRGCAGLAVRVRADGKRYRLTLRQDSRSDGPMYQAPLASVTGTRGEWQEVRVPFSAFVATYHGRELAGAPAVDPDKVQSIGFLIADKQAGPFRLEVDWVKAYVAE